MRWNARRENPGNGAVGPRLGRHALAAGMLVLALASPVRAENQILAGGEHCVTGVAPADRLNIRSGPSAGAGILATRAYRDCGLTVTGPCHAGWCPVATDGIAGWVNASYISMISLPFYCVSEIDEGGILPIHAFPAPTSRRLADIPSYACEIAALPHFAGDWQRVRWSGIEGWIARGHINPQ